MLKIGSGLVEIPATWAEMKAILTQKQLRLQCVESVSTYSLFAIDVQIIYTFTIFRDTVPTVSDTTQVQNDADKVDFEANYQITANQSLERKDSDGVPKQVLDSPREDDKKPVIVISPASEGFNTWLTGASDDLNPTPPNSGRGEGPKFLIAWDGNETFPSTKYKTFSFSEPMEIHDGQICWREPVTWGPEDTFSFGIQMPATTLTPNVTNTGNANAITYPETPPEWGMKLIVPAAGDGAYDIDLNQAVPIPTTDKNGYWDILSIHTGVITPSVTPGQAKYHLLNFAANGWLLRSIQMGHPMGVFDIDVYKSEYFHNRWNLYWEVTKVSTGPGKVFGWIFCFRKYVT